MGTDFSDLSPRGDEELSDTLNTNWSSTLGVEPPSYEEEPQGWFMYIILEIMLGWLFWLPLLLPFYLLLWAFDKI